MHNACLSSKRDFFSNDYHTLYLGVAGLASPRQGRFAGGDESRHSERGQHARGIFGAGRHYCEEGASFWGGGIILAEGAEDGCMDEDMKAGIDTRTMGARIDRGIWFGVLELRLEMRLPIG